MKKTSKEESVRKTNVIEFAIELVSFWDDYYGFSQSSLLEEAGGKEKVIHGIVRDILSHETEAIKDGLQVVADENDYMSTQAQEILDRLINLEMQINQ